MSASLYLSAYCSTYYSAYYPAFLKSSISSGLVGIKPSPGVLPIAANHGPFMVLNRHERPGHLHTTELAIPHFPIDIHQRRRCRKRFKRLRSTHTNTCRRSIIRKQRHNLPPTRHLHLHTMSRPDDNQYSSSLLEAYQKLHRAARATPNPSCCCPTGLSVPLQLPRTLLVRHFPVHPASGRTLPVFCHRSIVLSAIGMGLS